MIDGFDVIDKIATVETDLYDRPLEDVNILKVVPVVEEVGDGE